MINALEKVVYPNGKTQSLAEIGGAVEGLSALIDEVDKNTSAITSITSQLSALVSDVNTNTSAISSITSQLSGVVDDGWTLLDKQTSSSISSGSFGMADVTLSNLDDLKNKLFYMVGEVAANNTFSEDKAYITAEIDGDLLYEIQSNNPMALKSVTFSGDPSHLANLILSFYGSTTKSFRVTCWENTGSTLFARISVYYRNKPTPPARTLKKKAVVKKKGETK